VRGKAGDTKIGKEGRAGRKPVVERSDNLVRGRRLAVQETSQRARREGLDKKKGKGVDGRNSRTGGTGGD